VIDFVSTFILVVGFGDDLRSRKIHNGLVIGLFLLALIFIYAIRGMGGVAHGLIGSAEAFALTFPLVYMGAIGGGDMKLFSVFAMTSEPYAILIIYMYAIVAGAFIGLVRATVSGELMTVVRSTAAIATSASAKPSGTHSIPFSAALLLGWLTYWSMGTAFL
jgi:prepilin peptidase CpaA